MDKFFELISKLKELGIAAKLCSASSANALREEWNKFLSENSELIEEIKTWAQEYAEDENSDYIFAVAAEIEDPMEVAVLLRVCEGSINECTICENFGDFTDALVATEEKVAIAVADYVSSSYIDDITAEDIFAFADEDDADESETETEAEAITEESEATEIDDEDGSEKEADADEDYDAEEADSGEKDADVASE